MPTTVENIGPCRRRVQVNLNAEKVAAKRIEIVREFTKVATVPGFRAGKAPVSMLEKRYGSAIDKELQTKLIPEAVREAVKEHKLRVLGDVSIDQVRQPSGQGLSFVFEAEVAPDITLPDYKGIPVKKTIPVISDKQIEEVIEKIREQNADFADVQDRVVSSGDYVVVNFSGVANGKPLKELIPNTPQLCEANNLWLPVESKTFLPGFTDQLLGANIGEKRQVMIDLPDDFPVKEIAGAKLTYFVDVTGIKQKKLPDLDEAFAVKVGLKSLDDLRQAVRQQADQERDRTANEQVRSQIMEFLLTQTNFELPGSVLENETRSIVNDVVRENLGRGVSREEIESQRNEILGFATRSARERVKGSFILGAIAAAENIEATPSEINAEIGLLARASQQSPERVRAMLEKNDRMDALEERVIIAKTMDFLVAHAKIDEVHTS